MKKIAIFFLIIIIIVAGISYLYLNHKANYYEAKKENSKFEDYYEKEIYGAELGSIINRAVDQNNNQQLEKNNKGKFVENDSNSIKIDVKITDNNSMYDMETLYAKGMNQFVLYYNEVKFKCTNIQYHAKTNKVRYLLFEQISE